MNDLGFNARMVGMANLSFKLLEHTLGIDQYEVAEEQFYKRFRDLCDDMVDWMGRNEKNE